MDKNIIIDECFNCKKKKDIGDNWRTCKLKCSYKYKRKENDYITRLEQENKELIEDNLNLSKENKKLKYLISEEQCFEEGCKKCTKAYYIDDKYRSALEEIKSILDKEYGIISNAKAVGIINEVLN